MKLIKNLTVIRHEVVRLLAPKLYQGYLTYEQQTDRPMFKRIKSSGLKNLVGVEIGVSDGRNAERLLKKLDIKMLYLVDPYASYIDSNGLEVDPSEKFIIAEKRLSKYTNKVFIKKYSADSVSMLPQLDFVYIDGDHSYEAVKKDMKNYYSLVKPNGFFGGHDFYGKFKGVVMAVTEFVKEKKLKLHTDFYDWWVIKPATENN